MKYYVAQIEPEYQTPPLFIGEEYWPEGVAVTGNRDFNGHTFPAFDLLRNVWDVVDAWEDIQERGVWSGWNNITQALNNLVPRDDGKGYNTRQVHRWKKLLERWDDTEDDRVEALELITGTEYEYTTIRGTCQGEWNIMYHPVPWSREAVWEFEAEYFNTGAEWIVHDAENVPTCAADVSGWCIYTHAWSLQGVIDELSQAIGCNPDQLHIWEYRGSGEWGVAS